MIVSRKAIFELLARKQITVDEARKRLAALALTSTRANGKVVPLEQPSQGPRVLERAEPDDVAVIGMAARFPGAADWRQYWRNLLEGADAVTPVPPSRFRVEDWYDPDPSAAGRSISRWGAFLDGVDQFDSSFFKISAAEASVMDPQQRLFLEGAWHALEDAGYDPHSLAGSDVGLFIGAKSSRYLDQYRFEQPSTHPLASRMVSAIPARLAYFLNLKGPSMVLDTECSSSLVAIHQACRALRGGECELALAGGLSLLLDPELFVVMSKAQMLSPRGRCAAFDADADGIVMGEGLGLVVLKPLGRALRDRDGIYAVIKGSAVNQDGTTNGITAPNGLAQTQLAHDAWDDARVEPGQLGYIECHGTGTWLGDPIEVEALARAFEQRGASGARVPIGSVKTNLGHTLLAAGVAGLLKAALAVQRGQIPPTIHYRCENPGLHLAQSPFYVAERVERFSSSPRLASVSAFGASGTNCAVILEQAPGQPADAEPEVPLLWLFSGRNAAAARANALAFREWLGAEDEPVRLADAAFTLACGRTHFPARLAGVAQGRDELLALLEALREETASADSRWFRSGAGPRPARDAELDSLQRQLAAAPMPAPAPGALRARREVLAELARCYVAGAALDFAGLYPAERHRRLHLPGYVFQRQSHWWARQGSPSQTPLLERRYQGDEWFIAEHVIGGSALMPAAYSLNLLLEAARRACDVADVRALALEEIGFSAPLRAADGAVSVRSRPRAEREGSSALELCSQRGVHARARARCQGEPRPPAVELDALRAELGQRWEGAQVYASFRARGIEYGPGFHVLERLYFSERSALGELRLPESARSEASCALHPALVDGAFQAVLPLMGDSDADGPGVWIPYSIAALHAWGPLPERLHALAVAHQPSGAERLRRFELFLLDGEGQVLARLSSFTLRRQRSGSDAATAPVVQLLEPRWQAVALPAAGGDRARTALVLEAAGSPLAPALREALGGPIVAVRWGATSAGGGPGAADAVTIDEADPEPGRTLAAALDARGAVVDAFIDANLLDDLPSGERLCARLEDALYRRIALFRGLWASPSLRAARVLYVYPEAGGEAPSVSEALAGFYRTLQRERPEWQARVLALADTSVATLERFCRDVAAWLSVDAAFERECRLDAQHAWWARRLLAPRGLAVTSSELAPREHHLVTGGLGGIGKLLGEHLPTAAGAAVTLLGRSPLAIEQQSWLEACRARGARLHWVQADLCDPAALAAALHEARARFGPVHVVHHAAGVIRDALIVRKSRDDVARVLAPKVAGTLHLDAATRQDPLRRFVLYSAGTALLGNAGQADYAVANRFLDDFAAWRNRSDAPGRAVSVNWPLWRHGGMRVPEAAWRAMRADAGLAPLDSAPALEQLRIVLQASSEQLVSLCSVDASRLERHLREQGVPLASAARAPARELKFAAAPASPSSPVSEVRRADGAGAAPEAASLSGRVSEWLVERVARQVGVSASQLDPREPLESLGLDSIAAVQLTESLEAIAGPLSKTLFFEHRQLSDLVQALVESHRGALERHFGADAPAPVALRTQGHPTERWAWLRRLVAQETRLDEAALELDAPLDDLGLDSISALRLATAVRELAPAAPDTLFFEHRTLRSLLGALSAEHGLAAVADPVAASGEPALSLPFEASARPPSSAGSSACGGTEAPPRWYPSRAPEHAEASASTARSAGGDRHAIAIISVDGRYPDADSLDEFWSNLQQGRDSIREIPPDRWDHREFEQLLENRRSCKYGGFMRDVAGFDAPFFNISPREASLMDPQERLALETAWRVFENAGYSRARLQSDRVRGEVGVYMATMYPEYMLLGLESALRGEGSFANSMFASFANRISYFFDLRGPSLTLDTMCSGSLTAVALAVAALRGGQVRMAIAGGVSVISHPYRYVLLARGGFFSSDGRCRGFGEGGDGYVPGEGVGAVLLKRLDDAVADGDPIVGVIRGAALNHGGHSNGYTVPDPNAQAELIRRAFADAGVEPESISYVEAHGTGTALGDPIEIAGLTKAFGPVSGAPALGSVKSNIGHLEPAAGIAGLTKVLLQMRHGELVPTLHVEHPNPHVDWSTTPFRLQRRAAPWAIGAGPRRACISSFGAGGSNAHLILQEPPAAPGVRAAPRAGRYLVTLSARTPSALARWAAAIEARLRGPGWNACDVCWTLQHREPMHERAAAVVRDERELEDFFRQLAAGADVHGLWRGNVEGVRAPDETPEAPEAAARAFVSGRNVDWQRFGCRGSWVELPNYPFDRRRCWIPGGARAWSRVLDGARHPLLGEPQRRPDGGASFAIELDPEHPSLADHRVNGQALLPGVAVLELLREAMARLEPPGQLAGVQQLVWLEPVFAGAGAAARLELRPHAGEGVDWQVVSSGGRVLARGEATRQAGARPARFDLDEALRRCPREIDPQALYERFGELGVDYGPHFRSIERLHAGDGLALARLVLPGRAGLPLEALVPGVLDGALQAALGWVLDAARPELMLPFSIGDVRLHAPLPERLWAVARRASLQPGRGLLRQDVTLVDDAGGPCLELIDVASRAPLGGGEVRRDDDLYVPFWSAEAAPDPASGPSPATLVLMPAEQPALESLLAEREGTERPPSVALARFQPEGGDSAASLAALLERHARCERIFFVLPAGAEAPVDLERLRAAEQIGVLALRALVGALAAAGRIQGLSIGVVTHGQESIAADESGDATFAAVTGFVKSAAREFPGIRLYSIDLARDLEARPEEARATWRALLDEPAPEPGAELARRGRVRLVRRLRPLRLPAPQALPLRRGGVYLIIGGAGGLGVVFSRYLAERYAARTVWVGRRAHDPAIAAAEREVQAAGGEAVYLRADVTSPDDLRRVRMTVLERYGELHGIIHSAIVMHDGALLGQDEPSFRAALDPKASGAVALESVFGDDALDWIGYYSSANGLLGNAGQSNYTAGCTFQDRFAAQIQRTTGKRRWVIDWGYWGEAGIVSGVEHQQRLARLGVVPLTNRQGIDAFERVLGAGVSPVLAMRAERRLLERHGLRSDGDCRAVPERAPFEAADVRASVARWSAATPAIDSSGQARLEQAVALHVYERLAPCGLPRPGEPFSLAGIARALDLLPKYSGWLRAWVADLAAIGAVAADRERSTFVHDIRALPADSLDSIVARFPDLAAQVRLLQRCLAQLPDVLSGRCAATDVLFPNASLEAVEGVYRSDASAAFFNAAVCEAVCAAVRAAEGRPLAILEVGAGTGGTSAAVLSALEALQQPVRYVYTDVGAGFVQHGKRRFGRYTFVEFRSFDLEADPRAQGFSLGDFDVVIAANVVHATANVCASLRAVKWLMKRGGMLVLNEIASYRAYSHATFGLLDGWWKFSDAERRVPNTPALALQQWSACLGEVGFEQLHAIGLPGAASGRHDQVVMTCYSDGLVTTRAPHVGSDPKPPSKSEPAPQRALAPSSDPGAAVRRELSAMLCDILGCSAGDLHAARAFSDYGLDSILAVDFVTRINQRWQLRLRPTLLFDYNDLASLSQHLAEVLEAETQVGAPLTSADGAAVAAALAPAARDASEPVEGGGHHPRPPQDVEAVIAALVAGSIDIDQADAFLSALGAKPGATQPRGVDA